ncbi:MAG: flagellar basal body rod protein FlgC [Planctomycetota bacterium]|nr:MAG: flagellar basal body rod protein FlgC [Planctomycetota bacterium]
MYASLDISASALTAYRTQLDVIAGNIAMKDAVHFENGRPVPYRRRVPLLAPGDPSRGPQAAGVHVAAVVEDPAPFGLRWDPGHVYAIREGPLKGYVQTSNVDDHTEMVNAMAAARAYEANVTVMEMTKSMAQSTLRLIA